MPWAVCLLEKYSEDGVYVIKQTISANNVGLGL